MFLTSKIRSILFIASWTKSDCIRSISILLCDIPSIWPHIYIYIRMSKNIRRRPKGLLSFYTQLRDSFIEYYRLVGWLVGSLEFGLVCFALVAFCHSEFVFLLLVDSGICNCLKLDLKSFLLLYASSLYICLIHWRLYTYYLDFKG